MREAFERLIRREITAKEYADSVRETRLLGGCGNTEASTSPGSSRGQSPSTFRFIFLAPICWLIGHKRGYIPAWAPNPYASSSWQWGCTRCHTPLKFKAEVKS